MMTRLVTAGTALAAAVDTFYHLLLPEVLGDPADTSRCKVVVPCLYAPKAAKALITWLQRAKAKYTSKQSVCKIKQISQ
jgi:hypothetical protein